MMVDRENARARPLVPFASLPLAVDAASFDWDELGLLSMVVMGNL